MKEGSNEGSKDGVRGSDEATSAALGIDFPEPFGLFALLHDTKRCNEQARSDGGEPPDRCKRLVQQVVRLVGKLVHAPFCNIRDLKCRAHGTTNFHIGAIAVTTAIPLVLQCDTRLSGHGVPHFLIVDLYFEGAEPEDRREEYSKGRVEDEEPVEDDETDGYVVPLDDCAHGDNECDGIENSEDHANSEVHLGHDEIPKDVRCLPEDAKRDHDASGGKEKEVEGAPEGHQHHGHHSCRLLKGRGG
jgi:hypothetical protein